MVSTILNNLQTYLLEVGHMSRPKFFCLGLSNSVLKPTFMNMCGLPLNVENTHSIAIITPFGDAIAS